MNLDAISVSIRPRNHWESLDLGFRLVREHARRLYATWLVVYLPVVILVHLLLWQHLGWAAFVCWWLKPLLDRVPLHVLSHAVFGEPPSMRDTLRSLPQLYRRGSMYALTVLRLELARSFFLPVWQLEGLKGRAWRDRRRTLARRARVAASWHTVACLHFEGVIYGSLLALIVLMTPPQLEVDWLEWLSAAPAWVYVLNNSLYLVAVAVVEPWYVAGGFALYLNRRTILEGWDIEIAFRRLGMRLRSEVDGAAA